MGKERKPDDGEPNAARRNGNLAIPLPFDEAIKAAVEAKPPEKPPRKPRKRRTKTKS